MKKLFAMLLCLALLTVSAAALADAPAFQTIEKGKLLISTSPDFPPFEYTDDNDNVIGIEPELIALICEKIGLDPEWIAMDFDSRWWLPRPARPISLSPVSPFAMTAVSCSTSPTPM